MAAKSSEAKVETPAETTAAPVTAPALMADALKGPITPETVAGVAAEVIGMSTRLAGDNDDTHNAANEADVTDEVAKTGPAFGSFLKAIGLAVAETQAALDQTLVKTVTELANTKVRIPTAFVQELDDEGNVTEVEVDETTKELKGTYMQEYPALAFVDATGLGIRSVYLTADMDVEEFNTSNGFKIKKDHTGFDLNARASYGLFGGFNASGDTGLHTTSDTTAERRTTGSDKAAGKLHMEAHIEPRTDIRMPRPIIIQRGPRIILSGGARTESKTGTGDAAYVDKREVTVKMRVQNKKGEPIKDAQVEVSCDRGYMCDVGAADGDGVVAIKVTRDGMTKENNSPLPALVSARMNLVSAELQINI